MATRVLLHLGDTTNKCFFSNAQLHRTKFCLQSLSRHSKRHFRRIRNPEEVLKSPFAKIEAEHTNSGNSRSILKAFLFASSFSGISFGSATILEYERIRDETYKRFNRLPFSRPVKSTLTGWRAQARNWWLGLTEGQRVFYVICYANVMVFLAWRVPRFRPVMMQYFATNPASGVAYMPMLLSAFSHYNLWHLAANMYVLHSFSSAAVSYLGKEHFLALYMSSGVISSFCSNAYKIALKQPGYSLGASGAIMGVIGFICTQFPQTQLSIIFLPQLTFSAGAAIKSIMAFDGLGCILQWKIFDHAAHLGGALFGIFWQTWGIENIWRKRNYLLVHWHEFRNPPKSH